MTMQIVWRGIEIEVRTEANWLGNDITHIEVQTTPRTPLPITETGYRSHFIDPQVLAEYDGVDDFVHQWLEEAAKGWDSQLSLF